MHLRAWLWMVVALTGPLAAAVADLEDSRLYECAYTEQPEIGRASCRERV